MQEVSKLKGARVLIRFLQSGACGYLSENEIYYMEDEDLPGIAVSHEGVPLVIDHNDLNKDNVDALEVGYVCSVFRNQNGILLENGDTLPPDNWAWCEGIVTNEDAVAKIRQGWQVSNSYAPEFSDTSGYEKNGIMYNARISGGTGLHIAIVNNPRYEGAMILLNAQRVFKNSKDNKAISFSIDNNKNPSIIDANLDSKDMQKNSDTEETQEEGRLVNVEKDYLMNESGDKVFIRDIIGDQVKKEEEDQNQPEEEKKDNEGSNIQETLATILKLLQSLKEGEDKEAKKEEMQDEEDKEEKKFFNNSKQKSVQVRYF